MNTPCPSWLISLAIWRSSVAVMTAEPLERASCLRAISSPTPLEEKPLARAPELHASTSTSCFVAGTAESRPRSSVEEIPPGFSHCLILAEGHVVAAGLLRDVMTAENLSAAFGQSIAVDTIDGRYFARRARTRAAHRRRA